jgi:thiamine biosynthesis lipoprotein
MDTVTEVTLVVPQSYNVNSIWRSVDSLLSSSEKRFSVTNESSEIKALNERASQSILISSELGEMLKIGLAWGDSLNGAFDITVLPLKELWGFCEQCGGDEPLPDSGMVRKILQKVNYKKVSVNTAGDSVFFDSPDTRVDVGGIAKGFVLRRLGELLRNRGLQNFLIAAGGDILVSGRKSDNTPWRVGIRHPRKNSELILTIPMAGGAIVTSGDYERFRMVDGERYHHIFDPATGYPCNKNQSLTILADDPVKADILSTGLFCSNAERILEYIRARDGLECVIVDAAGEAHISSPILLNEFPSSGGVPRSGGVVDF